MQLPQHTVLPLLQLVPFGEQQSPFWHTPEQHSAPDEHRSSSVVQLPHFRAVDAVPKVSAVGHEPLHATPGGQHRTVVSDPVPLTHGV
jgi:hypothetical protein